MLAGESISHPDKARPAAGLHKPSCGVSVSGLSESCEARLHPIKNTPVYTHYGVAQRALRRIAPSISALARIKVGGWRDDATGPMQVVSGPMGRQRVHFEAPPAEHLETETSRFLGWLNGASNEPPLIRAGLGHLWFVTLHTFDDGNGRIARAIGDLLLARADGSSQRCATLTTFWRGVCYGNQMRAGGVPAMS